MPMAKEMSNRSYIVVGIGGATNSGKTTVCKRLKAEFKADVFNCDEYFWPEDSPNHVPLPQFNGHANWDIVSAVDMDALRRDVKGWIDRQSAPKLNNNGDASRPSVLLVEGILVLNHPPLESLFDLKYYFIVTKEQCEQRRNLRHYEPPDPEGYFEDIVWPQHLEYKQELLGRHDIKFVPGNTDLDPIYSQIFQDIRQFF